MFTILDTNLWLQAISTVRWITTFSRILRYYMQHPNPSEALKEIVNYIMKESGQNSNFSDFNELLTAWFHEKSIS